MMQKMTPNHRSACMQNPPAFTNETLENNLRGKVTKKSYHGMVLGNLLLGKVVKKENKKAGAFYMHADL